MSKQQPPRFPGKSVGDLLGELFDPKYQALREIKPSEHDLCEFLEAARQLFAHSLNKEDRQFLKMPIDTPSAAKELVDGLVRKIDEIFQDGLPRRNDLVRLHRFRLAQQIDNTLRKIDEDRASKTDLLENTRDIRAEAEELRRAKKSADGEKNKPEVDLNKRKLRWVREQVAAIQRANPKLPQASIANVLFERQKELKYWPTKGAVRAWLHRSGLLNEIKQARHRLVPR